MRNKHDGFIEYVNLSAYRGSRIVFAEYLEQQLIIPDTGEPVDFVSRLAADCVCQEGRLLRTGQGVSYDGDELTGLKYACNLNLLFKIIYVGGSNTGRMYSLNRKNSLYRVIPIPAYVEPSPTISASPFLEDIFAEAKSPREVRIKLSIIYSLLYC